MRRETATMRRWRALDSTTTGNSLGTTTRALVAAMALAVLLAVGTTGALANGTSLDPGSTASVAGAGSTGAQAADPEAEAKIAPWLSRELDRTPRTSFLVLLREQAPGGGDGSSSPAEVYARLTALAARTQGPVLAWLAERAVRVRPFWIINAVRVDADKSITIALAQRDDVAQIVGDPWVRGFDVSLALEGAWPAASPDVSPATSADPSSALSTTFAPAAPASGPEWGVLMVKAPDVWTSTGKKGDGIVVASCDTGVEWTHPAIKEKYRGWNSGTQTADHSYSWHDSILDLAAPLDDNDHGTHTTGTMVGDDGQGNQIGVAPNARWIGCRNMDHGNGRPSTYIECMEWALAPYPPGGNAMTDGHPEFAPHIVNNSWGCPTSEGCDPGTLRLAFARQREAGIFQIAAAGNSGPGCGSVSDPPAIYDEVFTTGAVDINKTIASFSSRGPVTIDSSNRRKPNVSAPGSDVRSSVRGGGYANFSGTSMASPHDAGVAALLWSVKPALKGLVDISRCLIEQGAAHTIGTQQPQNCGGTPWNQYPNNTSGWGLIDALATINLPNGDSDPVANACDCAPTNGGVFAPPPAVHALRFAPASKTQVAWDSLSARSGSGTHYDLIRGDVDALRGAGNVSGATCQNRDIAAATATDATLPAAGKAFYYLSRGRNACGLGDYGEGAGAAPRTTTVCD